MIGDDLQNNKKDIQNVIITARNDIIEKIIALAVEFSQDLSSFRLTEWLFSFSNEFSLSFRQKFLRSSSLL